MPRRKKNNKVEVTETEVKVDGDLTIENSSVETPDETEEVQLEKIDVVVTEEPSEENIVEDVQEEPVFDTKASFRREISKYEEKVGGKEAISLMQRLMKIRETGVIDAITESAYDQVANKKDLLNDYRNAQKKDK